MLALAGSSALRAETLTVPVRHEHFRKGAAAQLRVDESGITFTEQGKNTEHSRR